MRRVLFGRLKTEFFYPCEWKAITIEQFVAEVDAYIRWYNEKRIKISLGIAKTGRVSSEPRPELMKQSKFLSAPPLDQSQSIINTRTKA